MKKIVNYFGLAMLSLIVFGCNKDDAKNSGVLPEEGFMVSATQKVLIAPGNLQYRASTKEFRFAEHQYDTIGALNANISDTYDGWIDLFGYGTGANPTLCISYEDAANYNSFYTKFVDWGTNAIGSDKADTWYTPSHTEWTYILYTRPNANKLFACGTVAGVKGLIVLPDNWTLPEGLTFNPSIEHGYVLEGESASNWRYNNENRNGYTHNTYSAEQWTLMEQAGAIFLPVTGLRWGTKVNDGRAGYYWFCDIDEANSWPNSMVGYWLNFNQKEVASRNYADVAYGNAVRLFKKI